VFREIGAVTMLNLSSLPSRLGVSLIIVVGVAGVVAVLLGLLAMSAGFQAALVETAREDRVMIMQSGSHSEMNGFITNQQLAILEAYEGLALASGELYVTVGMVEKGSGIDVDVVGRGVSEQAFALRDEVNIVSGRAFKPGTGEIIVGIQAAQRYQGLDIGDSVQVRNAELSVVGHFAAAGTSVESEIWIDRSVVQDVYRRTGGVGLVRARLATGVDAQSLAVRIAEDPRLQLGLLTETEFFAEQSADRVALINVFAYFIAGVMGFGSVLAALNTMYIAVSRRTVEIATLRAVGFGAGGVVISVMIESMLLAIIGGLTGALLVYLALDGYAATTFNNASSSQVAFAFRVTPELALTGLIWALGLGFVGGLLPALRAARLPITRALRGD
jgi:putative ABC transport system permease protein